MNPEGCGYRRALERAYDQAGQQLLTAVEVFGPELQLSLVARGVGLGLVTRRAMRLSAHRGQIREVIIPELGLQVQAWLVRPEASGRLTTPIERFCKLLEDVVASEGI
jgi:DNA-binding transcriptional LysR family regulator